MYLQLMYLQLMYLQLMYPQLMYLQSHIYKNIPVSFDFITTWNQGVFLCSPCILQHFKVHGSVNRNNILIYIQQDATLHSLFYLETALHVSGGTITHHQERKQLYLQYLIFFTPLLLSTAIVEELELSSNSCWMYIRIFSNTVMNLNYEMLETRDGSVYPGLRCVIRDFRLSLRWKLILVFLFEE